MNNQDPLLQCIAPRFAEIHGIRFHFVEAGVGPLVILLHGFPEFWYSWRHQIPALAAAGFRVIAPDLRGYNKTEKPNGVANYRLELLSQDVQGLIEQAGERKAIVVGHDWGGAIAWDFAMHYPEAVEKLVILNAPHPAAFRRELRTLGQLRKSLYIFFFQLPWLPERVIRSGNFASFERMWRHDPVRPNTFTDEDIALYKQALAEPGALTAALNYYRAVPRWGFRRQVLPIHAPTLLIWGERDRYLGIRLTEGLDAWVSDLRIERIPQASHWVQCDAPEEVNRSMLRFLTS